METNRASVEEALKESGGRLDEAEQKAPKSTASKSSLRGEVRRTVSRVAMAVSLGMVLGACGSNNAAPDGSTPPPDSGNTDAGPSRGQCLTDSDCRASGTPRCRVSTATCVACLPGPSDNCG